jgi:hypothetical protein
MENLSIGRVQDVVAIGEGQPNILWHEQNKALHRPSMPEFEGDD